MPRYYFHFHDGSEHRDNDGVELPGADEARAEGVVFMGEKLKELDGHFWKDGEWRMTVVDEAGTTVCAVTVTGK